MLPVEPEDFTEATRAFFEKWTGGYFKDADQNPVLATFAHHPRLADLFSQFNVHLLTTTTLPAKARQIAIMRTAWITGAAYMWSSHLRTSVLSGLEPDFYGPVQVGAKDPYFTEFERTVIRATEDLVQDHKVSDANWRALAAEWNEQQLLDFLFTVGGYALIAGVMRSLGVAREPDLLQLAEIYGAP
jgi:alkylhydroperoxidase family enzyme